MNRFSLLLLLLVTPPAVAQPGFVKTKEPVFEERRATCDLPRSQRHQNVGSNVDGYGLCVFSSIWHDSIWGGVSDIYGFRDWMRSKPGGGFPEKVDAMLKQYCREKGVVVPSYIQHTGGEADFLDLAMKTGRMVGVTYCGVDPNYGNQVVAHMVNLCYLDSSYACLLDNNFTDTFLWMPRDAFLQRWVGIKADGSPYKIGRSSVGGGWAIVFLNPPPPPYPHKIADVQFGIGGEGSCICGSSCDCASKGKVCPGGCTINPVSYGQAADITWHSDYKTAYNAAKSQKKPLFTVVGSADCPPCAKLAATLKTAEVVEALRGFVCVKVDGGADAKTRQLLAVEAYPTVFVADADLNISSRLEGNPKPETLLAAVRKVATKTEPISSPPLVADYPPGGVDSTRLTSEPQYWINGRLCTKHAAKVALFGDGNGLTDDSGRWHLTVVGDAQFQSKVKAEVATLPDAVKSKLHVQVYGSGDWQVAQFALSPGVTLRLPAVNRVGAEVGFVAVGDWGGGRLQSLLTSPGGPTPVTPPPKPIEPTPSPTPPQPTPLPIPDPAPPLSPSAWLAVLLAAVLAWLAARWKK